MKARSFRHSGFLISLLLISASILLNVVSFFGISRTPLFLVLSSTLTNSIQFIGLAFPFSVLLARNRFEFWSAAMKRAVIPVLISSLFYYPYITSIYFIISHFLTFASEAELIYIALFSVLMLNLLAYFKVIYEFRKGGSTFDIGFYDFMLIVLFLVLSFILTPPMLRIGDTVTTAFSMKRMNIALAFTIRAFLSAIPASFFAVPFFALTCVRSINLSKRKHLH